LADALWLTGLIVACLVGVALLLLQLPGSWLIVAVALVYDWHYGWQRIGWPIDLMLLGLAAAGELIELLTSAWLARRAGASRRAAIFGLLGGMAGMILFSVPVPIVGTLIGGVLGCFAGALIAEMTVRDDALGATRVGAAAAAGRVLGTTAKLATALAMCGVAIIAAMR